MPNIQQTDHASPFCRRSKAQRTKNREGTVAVAFRCTQFSGLCKWKVLKLR